MLSRVRLHNRPAFLVVKDTHALSETRAFSTVIEAFVANGVEVVIRHAHRNG
ncbi:hypothetical protein OK016_04190 [Vibrio chagasii]|nr:hypothetical protein [Vibrio chagasii]